MKKLQLLWLFLIAIVFFGTTNVLAQEVGLQLYSLRNQFKEDIPSTLKLINDWGIPFWKEGIATGCQRKSLRGCLPKIT